MGGLECLYHLLLPGCWRSIKGKRDSQLKLGQLSVFKSTRYFNDPVLQLNGAIYDVLTDCLKPFLEVPELCVLLLGLH